MLTLVFRHVWTVSVVVVKTPTWPMERRNWRPLLSLRKPWSRLASRWASTLPASRQQRFEVQPPALPGTPFSTSPRQRGHQSQPPSCRVQDTTAGRSTIHWRCGSTAEAPSACCSAHSSPQQLLQLGVPGTCGGQSQNKAATVTGASQLAAWNCTMLVVLHTDAERKQEQRRCSVTVCAEISFQLRHLCVVCCVAHAGGLCVCVCETGAFGGQHYNGRNRDVIFIRLL